MDNKELNLIASARSGNGEDFAALYDLYVERIYRFIYYKVYHKETAEDLVSQTFLKAYEKLGTFDTDKGTFSAWLYRIAHNAVVDHLRSGREEKNIEDIFDLSDEADLMVDTDKLLSLEGIREVMATLKPLQRQILTLRVWEELSYAEIAQIVGKSEDHCKVEFSRSLKALRKALPLGAFLLFILTK